MTTRAPPPPLGLAFDAAEAVVAEGEVEHGVVGAAADVGPLGGRPGVDDDHPGGGDGERHGAEHREPPGQLSQRGARNHRHGDDDGQRERRSGYPAGEHLDVEGDADEKAGERGPRPPASTFQRSQDGARCSEQGEDEERLRKVQPVDGDGDRRERQGEGGYRRRRQAEVAPHDQPEQADAGGAGNGAGQQDRPLRVAEDAGGERTDPEERRRLVDGDESARVEGAKKKFFQHSVMQRTAAA